MVFKKIIFQNRYVALETPSRPPPFMANTILNFHFDYLNNSLSRFNLVLGQTLTKAFLNKYYQDYYHKVRPRDPRHYRRPQIEVLAFTSFRVDCPLQPTWVAHFHLCFCSFWSLFLLTLIFVFAHFDLCICFVTNPKWEIWKRDN